MGAPLVPFEYLRIVSQDPQGAPERVELLYECATLECVGGPRDGDFACLAWDDEQGVTHNTLPVPGAGFYMISPIAFSDEWVLRWHSDPGETRSRPCFA